MGRAGSDLALETADAVVVRDELAAIPTAIPTAIVLSRRARRLVIQNLAIAATFITGLVIWDLAGHLPLPLGVAGHEGSTVLVALNGLRLLRDTAGAGPARSDTPVSPCRRTVINSRGEGAAEHRGVLAHCSRGVHPRDDPFDL